MTRRSPSGRITTPALAALVLFALLAGGCALTPSAADLTAGARSGGDGGSGSDSSGGRAGDPAAVPSDVDPELERFYSQRIQWSECMDGHFECGTLEVPLDYAKPDGKTLELALLRFTAKDPENRIGSLVLNPGGPGGSGVDYASYAPGLFSEAVKQRYDLVGFDPRGVGKSATVECLTDKQLDEFRAVDGVPDDEAELTDLEEASQQLIDGCVERTGRQLLGHVSTEEAARDIDVLRNALGDEKLHYYGASYGTYLGATYAKLFPQRSGRLAFDGGLDPSLTDAEVALGQAEGFEQSFRSFLDWCGEQPDCELSSDQDAAYAAVQDLLAEIDEEPLPADGPRDLTGSLASSAMVAGMYQTGLWYDLMGGLNAALSGDGTPLLQLVDTYSERSSDGKYKNNASEVIYAVNCLDRQTVADRDELRALEPEAEDASALFGRSILWGSLPCTSWPVESRGEPEEIHAKGAAPILVIGTTGDPATPYEWSESLADQLDSGVLLTREGEGHTSSGSGVDPCVQRHLDAFLAKGKTPADGTVCSG